MKRPSARGDRWFEGRDHAVALPTMSQNTPWVRACRWVLARKSALWAIACLAAAALWIDFSAIQRHQNSDTLMMVFISVYKWTPLFWEQDRLGMFFPLLALPWRDPWNNMLAQGAMTIFACLGGFFLLGYFTLGRSLGLVAGAMSSIAFVLLLTSSQQFDYMIFVHHFGTSSAIGLLGLILLARWSASESAWTFAGGLACVVVANWINPGVAFALAPLWLARRHCFAEMASDAGVAEPARCVAANAFPVERRASLWPSRWLANRWRHWRPTRQDWTGLFVIVGALAASMIVSRTASYRQPYRFLSPSGFVECAALMWNNLDGTFDLRWFRTIELAAVVGVATLVFPSGRRALRVSLPIAAVLLAVAAVQFAFMSSINHVLESRSPRYLMMAVFFWQAACVGFCVVQLAAVLPRMCRASTVAATLAVAVIVAAGVAHGRPGSDVVRAEIDRSLGRFTDDILAARCTHVTGDYWRAWTAMFHVNLRLAEAGSPRRVWAICHRSRATAKYWQQVPLAETRIAEIVGDEPQSLQFRQHYQAPAVVAAELVGTIRVLRAIDDAQPLMAGGKK